MRWSIIRLIWLRELRDQLRDRRTLFMIAVLPILLYPVAGVGMIQLAQGFQGQTNKVRIVGHERLSAASPLSAASWFACTPAPPGCPLAGVERVVGAAALATARHPLLGAPLVESAGSKHYFPTEYFDLALDRNL